MEILWQVLIFMIIVNITLKKNPLILTSDYKIEFGLLNVNNKNYITKYIDGPKLKVCINLGYIFLIKKKF